MTDQAELDQQADVDLDELERLHEAAPTREVMSYLIGGGALEFYAAAKSAVPKLLALARRALAPEAKGEPTRARLYSTMRRALNEHFAKDTCSIVNPKTLQVAIEAVATEYDFDDVHRRRSEMCESYLREFGGDVLSLLSVMSMPRFRDAYNALDALMKEFGLGK